MRKLNFTIQIEDNDLIEHNVIKLIHSILGDEKVIDYRRFPKTDHLKDDTNFKKLQKAKRDAGLYLDRYINENRNK